MNIEAIKKEFEEKFLAEEESNITDDGNKFIKYWMTKEVWEFIEQKIKESNETVLDGYIIAFTESIVDAVGTSQDNAKKFLQLMIRIKGEFLKQNNSVADKVEER